MKKRLGIIVAFLVVLVALLRIMAATSTPYFSDDTSYQNLRLASTGINSNSVYDPLSFGGRTQIVNPLSTAILWSLHIKLNPILGYKIVLNFIAALHIALIFLIALRMCERPVHALLAASLGACIPIHYLVTLNSVSIIPISFLFFLLALYYYIAHIQQPTTQRFTISVSLFLLSSILHPLFLVFLFGLICYHIYCISVSQKTITYEREILIASFLVSLVFNYIIYYKALLAHGLTAFWQSTLFVPYVNLTQILPLLPQMGLVLFAVAMYTVFKSFEERNSKHVLLLAGLLTSSFIATIFRLIAADIGLLIISMCCVLLVPLFFDEIYAYVSQTKIQKHASKIIYVLWGIFFILSLIPTIIYSQDVIRQATDPQIVSAYFWINTTAQSNSIVIVPIANAQAAMYFADRKTIMDSHVLLVNNPKQRADSLDLLYTSPYPSTILSTLGKFNVSKSAPAYIFFSNKLDLPRSATSRGYDNDCFSIAYNDSLTTVYKSECEVLEQ